MNIWFEIGTHGKKKYNQDKLPNVPLGLQQKSLTPNHWTFFPPFAQEPNSAHNITAQKSQYSKLFVFKGPYREDYIDQHRLIQKYACLKFMYLITTNPNKIKKITFEKRKHKI